MDTVAQGHCLRALGGSTVAAASLDAAGPAEFHRFLLNLNSELSSRCHHQKVRISLTNLPLNQKMERGQQEGKRLSAARRCHADHIIALHRQWPSILLNL
eukprot:Skav208177  [mRNA]  locus=scaffold2530:63075:65509:- [translate_table: standard]